MTITSFYYLIFITVGALFYYMIPRAWQWVELLILSIIFYCTAASPLTILYLAGSTLLAYVSTNFMEHAASRGGQSRRNATAFLTLAVILNILIWFVAKADSILVSFDRYVRYVFPSFPAFSGFSLAGALGMGYYTLQVIGYILDCCWETIKPQKNPLKLFLFVCFFPQLTTGPISRYTQLEILYEKHRFSYQNLCFGSQRILWGFFKKLVLAERAGSIVNGVWANLDGYSGFWHWIALLVYPIQMYADFSGCMDIVLGTAELFDLRLPENFNNPFFSRTSQEFWQRWHITLGVWAKDYVLYPILKSGPMVRFSKFARKKYGKKQGKFLSASLGMLALWLVMGIWHGGVKYIVGVSLWYWIILMLGDLLASSLKKLNRLLCIPTDSFSWHLFQSGRTYLIYAVGAVFFRANGLREAVGFLRSLIGMFVGSVKEINPWIFFDGSILTLGLSWTDVNLLIFGVLFLLIVAILREKYGYARKWMADQMSGFRWFVWLVLFVLVLIYGKYGPGYDASEFIYKGF